MTKEILRSEQKQENTWDLSTIYSDLSAYEKDYDIVNQYIDKINTYKNIVTDIIII